MRISDWSSDVCSSDLLDRGPDAADQPAAADADEDRVEIGRLAREFHSQRSLPRHRFDVVIGRDISLALHLGLPPRLELGIERRAFDEDPFGGKGTDSRAPARRPGGADTDGDRSDGKYEDGHE